MGVNVSIDKSKLNPAFLDAFDRKVKRDIKNAVIEASTYAVSNAKSLTPVDTGSLRESINTVLLDDTSFAFGSNLPYAKYQEYGTRKIRPVAFLRRALAKTIIKFKQLLLTYK